MNQGRTPLLRMSGFLHHPSFILVMMLASLVGCRGPETLPGATRDPGPLPMNEEDPLRGGLPIPPASAPGENPSTALPPAPESGVSSPAALAASSTLDRPKQTPANAPPPIPVATTTKD